MSERGKVTEQHRRRRAVVYVRQSTLHQVERNVESSARQYALRERAIELGWPAGSVSIVDEDTGRSGASADERLGFKELVAEVGLGQVGIVLALEVSRLARSSADWHQLLDLCALTGTLIADSDGIYSPADFNDRLLLGLKGTMSEAELHLIRARLDGGLRNKAERGELRLALPVGLERDADERIVLSPDEQVRQAIERVFSLWRRLGSARQLVLELVAEGQRRPLRPAHAGRRLRHRRQRAPLRLRARPRAPRHGALLPIARRRPAGEGRGRRLLRGGHAGRRRPAPARCASSSSSTKSGWR